MGQGIKSQLVEVVGQKKLLKWSVPGVAHAFVFYAFIILATVYLEAYGALFDPDFAIPLIGHWAVLGFAQDLIAVLALLGIITFALIRLKAPKRLGRKSRFEGSHLGGAWMTLFMIFNVIWTLFLFRGAGSATGHLPYESGAFVSIGLGNLMDGMSEAALELTEHIGLLLHIGVMLVFAVLVVHSKHLHIFVAPLNVMFGREPGGARIDEADDDRGQAVQHGGGRGEDEDTKSVSARSTTSAGRGCSTSATCTECGRCQDQCPAWKPRSRCRRSC